MMISRDLTPTKVCKVFLDIFQEVSHLQKRNPELVELRSPGGTDWLFLVVSGYAMKEYMKDTSRQMQG